MLVYQEARNDRHHARLLTVLHLLARSCTRGLIACDDVAGPFDLMYIVAGRGDDATERSQARINPSIYFSHNAYF